MMELREVRKGRVNPAEVIPQTIAHGRSRGKCCVYCHVRVETPVEKMADGTRRGGRDYEG